MYYVDYIVTEVEHMLYEVEGKSSLFDYADLDKMLSFAIEFLDMPNDSLLTVRFSNDLEVAGFCDEVDIDAGEVEIELNNKLTLQEAIATVFHELVHCRQILEGRLVQGNPSTWDGVEYTGDYMLLPWEIEAYALEKQMCEAYNEQNN